MPNGLNFQVKQKKMNFSAMGITVFDLFNEIITEYDMQKFLDENSISGVFSGASLILRAFLLMVDMANCSLSMSESDIKIEDIGSTDEFDDGIEVIPFNDNEQSDADDGSEIAVIDVSEEEPFAYPELVRTCKTQRCGCQKVFPTRVRHRN